MAGDLWLFQLINGLAGRIAALDYLMRIIVNDYFLPTGMGLVAMAMWFEGTDSEERARNQRGAMQVALALGLANFLLKVANLLYFRERPFVHYQVNLLFYQPTDSSLPSNAAVIGFSIATAAWLHNRRFGVALYILAALFGFARIYCGVHYPLDILAGALLGAFAAGLLYLATPFLRPVIQLVQAIARRLFPA